MCRSTGGEQERRPTAGGAPPNRRAARVLRDTWLPSVGAVLARVTAFAIDGLDSRPVTVEVDIRAGLPAFAVVGLADKAVREARERVRSAVLNSGFEFPQRRITSNLAPAYLRKVGPGFDLAIAVGLLAASAARGGAGRRWRRARGRRRGPAGGGRALRARRGTSDLRGGGPPSAEGGAARGRQDDARPPAAGDPAAAGSGRGDRGDADPQ